MFPVEEQVRYFADRYISLYNLRITITKIKLIRHATQIFVSGFQNSLNEVSVVQLKVSCPGDPGSKTDTVAEGQPYKLRAEVLKYDRKNFNSIHST